MPVTFLPIVARELRVGSRRAKTYGARSAIVLASLLPLGWILLQSSPFLSPAQLGIRAFSFLTFIAIICAVLATVTFTADCLSSEKREGTLGLLFLTDLNPYDVVFGKLAATSLTALYGLLALIPVLSVPVLSGGVTLVDVGRLAVVLLNALFFAASLAILISAISWDEKKAAGLTSLLLGAFFLALPAVVDVATSINSGKSWASLISLASPAFACGYVLEQNYRADPQSFWLSTGLTHLLSWLMLGVTCRVLPHVWQDRPAGIKRLRIRQCLQSIVMGGKVARSVFRTRLLGMNPIFWLESRQRRVTWYPWIFLISILGICVGSAFLLRARSIDVQVLITLSVTMHWFFRHWLTNNACQGFSTDHDKNTLELLFSTPLTVREILRGYAMSLRRMLLPPILLLLTIELVCFGFALTPLIESRTWSWLFAPAIFVSAVTVFCADLVASAWVGWWAGITSKNRSKAVWSTYLRLHIIPWVLVIMTVTVWKLLGNPSPNLTAWVALALWTSSSLMVDFKFAQHARRKLYTELRNVAAERFSDGDVTLRWWRSLGPALARGLHGRP